MKILEEMNKDFEKNKEKYFRKIREIAEKYNGKAYIFGSYLRGESLAGSDVDVLVVVPENVDRLKVLFELRKEIKNRKFEFHVLNKKEGKLFLKLIGEYMEIQGLLRNYDS